MNARVHQNGKQHKAKKPRSASSCDSDQVAQLAYQLYQESGCEDGHDLEHWFHAEQILASRAHDDEHKEALASSVAPVPKARETAPTHSVSRTASREEIRRQQIPPAARQSHSR
jgi:hypothetical protein